MDSHLLPIFSFGIATFVVGLIMFPIFIDHIKNLKLGKQIREEGLIGKAIEFAKLHKNKVGTPSMGGTVIIFVVFLMVIISVLLQKLGFVNNSLLNQRETYLPLFTLFTVGMLGLLDDYLNAKGVGKTKGISARVKMFGLTTFATLGALWFYYKLGWNVTDEMGNFLRGINNPFGEFIKIGYWFIPLFIIVIISSANSVNITDGLDGLAGGLLLFSYSIYTYITYDQGLFLLSTFCMTIVGSLIAFLWFNVKPAKIYMGDVGSLSLGATLGILAMITNTLFVLLITGTIFILETLSVIIQLTSKKLRNGKKVFRIAPYHHHLEAIGWSEENVVFRLRLIGIITSVIGIITYILQK
ncbi:MAG: phospho-N-acetylmuramoyl-pentapeptide-transferase [Candidatus Gracilibacteria bacterium]|nr:phospho-N-acetylmuramoyl-pentapeptide-transferase [Candidatus Gracilibacteria bacterium]